MEVDGGRGGASCPRGVGSRELAEKQDGLEIFQWLFRRSHAEKMGLGVNCA